jgi:hypothetical protein
MSDDSDHVLTVRSHWCNDGGSDLELACSCGWFGEDWDDRADGGEVSASLAAINEAAARHLAEIA